MDARTREIIRLRLPSGTRAQALALSPDGKTVVYTALRPNKTGFGLFEWRLDSKEPPVQIGEDTGYHADPVVSADGDVYFAHNRTGGGPVGGHAPGENAQLFRVQLTGGALEQLTDGPGCHYGPNMPIGGHFLFIHTGCSVMRSVMEFDLGKRVWKRFVSADDTFREISSAPDDSEALYFVDRPEGVRELRRVARAGNRASELLMDFSPEAQVSRPRYGADRDDILVQSRCSVLRLRGEVRERVADMTGGVP